VGERKPKVPVLGAADRSEPFECRDVEILEADLVLANGPRSIFEHFDDLAKFDWYHIGDDIRGRPLTPTDPKQPLYELSSIGEHALMGARRAVEYGGDAVRGWTTVAYLLSSPSNAAQLYYRQSHLSADQVLSSVTDHVTKNVKRKRLDTVYSLKPSVAGPRVPHIVRTLMARGALYGLPWR
jgi:hypothetical protein